MEIAMRKIIITSLLAIGLTAGMVYAHGSGYGGRMMGPGMMGGGYGGQMMGPGMMGGGYGGQMMGPGMMGAYGNCPCSYWFGQHYQSNEGYQKFMKDTVGIRKELNNKHFEYREARRNPNTTREQLNSIEKEMFNLEKQLQEKAQQYR
jgi:hypothetical protein